MKYMLDTNSCIFAINNASEKLRLLFAKEYNSGIAVSAITEAELWYGVENSSKPEKNAEILRAFLATVEIIEFDTLAAAEYGRVRAKLKRAGTPVGLMDMLIASHAKSLNLICVTNNVSEFKRVDGLIVEDWTV